MRSDPSIKSEGSRTTDAAGVAERDAMAIATRVGDDEAAAAAARELYRSGRVPVLVPDDRVRGHLAATEHVHAVRESAVVEVDHKFAGAGRLYLTSHRLLVFGRDRVSIAVSRVAEAAVSADRLLLELDDGVGVAVLTSSPQLLRVQLAAVRLLARTSPPRGERP